MESVADGWINESIKFTLTYNTEKRQLKHLECRFLRIELTSSSLNGCDCPHWGCRINIFDDVDLIK